MAKQAKTPLGGMRPRGDDPATNAAIITPSDTVDLVDHTRAIYVGGAGNITVLMSDDQNDSNTRLFSAVPVGTVLPICARRILATATTATLLVALY